MKIFSLVIVLLALFQETRHQFPLFYPTIGAGFLSLANEEFIEPPSNQQSQEAVSPSSSPNDPPSSPVPQLLSDLVKEAKENNYDIGEKTSITEPPQTIEPLSPNNKEKQDELGENHSGDFNAELHTTTLANNSERNESQTVDGTPSTPVVLLPDAQKKGEDEEPIPSYMEWAQKKQLELKSNNNGQLGGGPLGNGAGNQNQGIGQNGQVGQNGERNGSVTSAIDAKNFASPDCGAKVVQFNSESQNPSGVLSSSHDEYMLNKCGANIWFVVELCEPLTIERVSVGNLELFSSSPKEIEIGISDRYPTRDWVKLGPFILPDSRAIHPLVLPSSNSSTFGKFVKVSILSHYGSEHFCPVSLIKVNGKSEYEVLESETTHEEDENKIGNGLYEEPIEIDQPQPTESPEKVKGIKDAFWDILNKAVQTIIRKDSSSSSVGSSENDQLLSSKCRSVLQCVSQSPMDQEIYKLLSCNHSNLLPFLAANSPWCGWDYCHATFESRSIGLPWQPEGFYASIFGGPSVLHALCHYLRPLTDGCDPTCLAMNTTNINHEASQGEYINESITANNNNITLGKLPLNEENVAQIPSTTGHGSNSSPEEQAVFPNPSADIIGTTPSAVEQQQQQQPQIDTPIISPPSTSPSSSAGTGSGIPIHHGQQQQQQQTHQQHQETQIPPPPNPAQQQEDQQVNNQFQTGNNQPQQKESVFVRLTNRIKNLERNQSLTASYLEELSKRFKKQNEDSALIVEGNKKTLNETRIKLLQLDEYYRQELQSLRRNLDDVRERLFNVQLQRSFLVVICITLTVIIIMGFLWMKRKFTTLEYQLIAISAVSSLNTSSSSHHKIVCKEERRRGSDSLIQLEPSSFDSGENGQIFMRKRSNSASLPGEKPKKFKKKKHKQLITSDQKNNNPPVIINPKIVNVKQETEFKIPKSRSGEYFRTTSSAPLTPKENIDPQFVMPTQTAKSFSNFNNNSTSLNPTHSQPQQLLHNSTNPSLFLPVTTPKVDSSSFSFSPFGDVGGISTSSRFALLASPVRDSPPPHSASPRSKYFTTDPIPFSSTSSATIPSTSNSTTTENNHVYKRSGSTESSASTSSSLGSRNSFRGIFNGHSKKSLNFEEGPSENKTVKKEKKVGLKFLPKFFDR